MNAASRIIIQLPDAKARLKEMRERADADRFRFRNKTYLESVRQSFLFDQILIEEQREKVEQIEAAIQSIEDETTRKIVSLRSRGKSWVAISMAVEMSENGARNRFDRACEYLTISFIGRGLISL